MTGRTVLTYITTLAALGCGSGSTPADNNPPPAGDITVGNNFYNPAGFSTPLNSTVTWAWNSSGIQHNVTFDDGQHSDTQGSGTYQRTFTVAGSYTYHCTIHGAAVMSGTVTVSASQGTGGGGGSGGGGGGTGGGGAYGGGM
ncbi:MAG TPA: plastocyanin/azurin family copper-binding protein [Gemmatimonadales bacterium]|jgi:plastocyanin